MSHDYERGQVVESVLERIDPTKAGVQKWNDLDLVQISSHLQTATLFGDEPVAIIENAESITKSDGIDLEKLFPKDFGYLIFSAKSKCAFSSAVETAGVVLDLLTEKPWEKEKRIQQTLEQVVAIAGKTMASNAWETLFEGQDVEEGILEREIEKLLCYTGDRRHISVEDVETICKPNKTYAIWQTAEQVIWEGQGFLEEAHFHVLVPALRSQLQLGLKITTLISENATREEWAAALPRVFPKTLEKRTRDAGRLGVRYFKRGLETLFEIELKSRSGAQNLKALLDFFHCTLYAG